MRLTHAEWKAVLNWAGQTGGPGLDTSHLPKVACTIVHLSGTATNSSAKTIRKVLLRFQVEGPDFSVLHAGDYNIADTLVAGASASFKFNTFVATKHVEVAKVSAALLESP
ncbi:MAG: hypothetical protein ABIH23_25445 [bacterium]